MSVFTEYVESSDEVLLSEYTLHQDKDGAMLIPKEISWDSYNNRYSDINYTWRAWRLNRHTINSKFTINIKKFSKSAWLNALNKKVERGKIKTHTLHGVTFYNDTDVYHFHREYELMVVWRYCRYHKYHWTPGKKTTLCNEDGSDSYEFIEL